jgi:hypothetical protein
MQDITFVGLDVHKGDRGVGRSGGAEENRPEVVRRLVERRRRGGQELRVCYEAARADTVCTGRSPALAAIVSWWRRP